MITKCEPLDVKKWLTEDELEDVRTCTGSYTGRVVSSFASKLAAANAKIAELQEQYDYTNGRYKEDVEALQALLNKRQTDETA